MHLETLTHTRHTQPICLQGPANDAVYIDSLDIPEARYFNPSQGDCSDREGTFSATLRVDIDGRIGATVKVSGSGEERPVRSAGTGGLLTPQ